METMGEKHAFFKKRKCGSRKVLRFMRSLLYALAVLSLPMRGAWIEIPHVKREVICLGRSPCGERGLKYYSMPVVRLRTGRSPCGERGLKFIGVLVIAYFLCRSPCGERGLKYKPPLAQAHMDTSLPMRGAWIEMFMAW